MGLNLSYTANDYGILENTLSFHVTAQASTSNSGNSSGSSGWFDCSTSTHTIENSDYFYCKGVQIKVTYQKHYWYTCNFGLSGECRDGYDYEYYDGCGYIDYTSCDSTIEKCGPF